MAGGELEANGSLMYRLFLLRHAEASPAKPGGADIDRPLTERGRQDAIALGERMRAGEHLPAFVFCSSARRTQETWQALASQLAGPVPQILNAHELYRGGIDDYRILIASAPTDGPILVIGHNPVITQLASTLVRDGDPAAMKRLTAGFPTCGLATIDFAESWSHIGPRGGTLAAFLLPGS